jgi:hypothetical protein
MIMSAQDARGPSENGHNVAHHHARHTASARGEHLLWAMDLGKGRDLRDQNRSPLPIMDGRRGRDSPPSRLATPISQEIEARPAGNLFWPEKQIYGLKAA